MMNGDMDENEHFFHDVGDANEEESNSQQVECSEEKEKGVPTLTYNPKKPLWWNRLSRRSSKGQRRTIAAMKHYTISTPRYGEYIDWNEIFSSCSYQETWYEIGIGMGDNLLSNAERHPDKAMFGAELHSPGVATLLKRIQQAEEQGRYWNEYLLYDASQDDCGNHGDEQSSKQQTRGSANDEKNDNSTLYSNVRIYPGNGMKLLNLIPTSSLSAVLLTFPDPFPQERQAQFRLLHVSNASDFHRVLTKNGRLYLATDHEGFFEWCQSVMEQCQDLFAPVVPVPERSTWLPVISKYEQKGLNEGRHTQMACWEAVSKEDNENDPGR